MSLTARPLTGLALDAEWQFTDATLDQGRFDTHVFRFNGTYSPTPDLSFSTRIQFDNLSDRLGLFARLRWITRPGSDLYLVLTRNWRYTDDRFSPLNSELASKLTYSIRF